MSLSVAPFRNDFAGESAPSNEKEMVGSKDSVEIQGVVGLNGAHRTSSMTFVEFEQELTQCRQLVSDSSVPKRAFRRTKQVVSSKPMISSWLVQRALDKIGHNS